VRRAKRLALVTKLTNEQAPSEAMLQALKKVGYNIIHHIITSSYIIPSRVLRVVAGRGMGVVCWLQGEGWVVYVAVCVKCGELMVSRAYV